MKKIQMKYGLALQLTKVQYPFRFFNCEEKDTFKTAFEIDQRWIIELRCR